MAGDTLLNVLGYTGAILLVVVVVVLVFVELSQKARKALGLVAGLSGLAVVLRLILGDSRADQNQTGGLSKPEDTRLEDDAKHTDTDRQIDSMRTNVATDSDTDPRISAERKRELDEFIGD